MQQIHKPFLLCAIICLMLNLLASKINYPQLEFVSIVHEKYFLNIMS
ncbi:hypothetical protein LSO9J_30051 [Candidatus Liberibacter solanacearum]